MNRNWYKDQQHKQTKQGRGARAGVEGLKAENFVFLAQSSVSLLVRSILALSWSFEEIQKSSLEVRSR